MGRETELAEEVSRLTTELAEARRLLRGVGVMCLNASAPQRVVEVDEGGTVRLGQPRSVGDGVLDREDVAGVEWQVAQ